LANLREQVNVNHDTANQGHLYAIRFSSGTVKVGRSRDVPRRITAHLAAAAIHDVTAECVWISEPVDRLEEREADLLGYCAARWEVSAGGEYFRRADVALIVKYANDEGIATRDVRGALTSASPSAVPAHAAKLRTAMESALQSHAYAVKTSHGIRIYAPAPAADSPRWRDVLHALNSADRWGSANITGTPEIWAEVEDEGTL
jgi:hypothetical protein